jgi:hypothetical protein
MQGINIRISTPSPESMQKQRRDSTQMESTQIGEPTLFQFEVEEGWESDDTIAERAPLPWIEHELGPDTVMKDAMPSSSKSWREIVLK